MNSKKINIGVIGVGHLGQYHVKHYAQMKNINFLGLHDSDPNRGLEIAKQYGVKFHKKASSLMKACDGASIVTPTIVHYEVAKRALKEFNCNVFIEKPITKTVDQANDLIKIAKNNNLIIGSLINLDVNNFTSSKKSISLEIPPPKIIASGSMVVIIKIKDLASLSL